MQLLSLIRFIVVFISQFFFLFSQTLQLVQKDFFTKFTFITNFIKLCFQLPLCGLQPVSCRFVIFEQLFQPFLFFLLLLNELVTFLQ